MIAVADDLHAAPAEHHEGTSTGNDLLATERTSSVVAVPGTGRGEPPVSTWPNSHGPPRRDRFGRVPRIGTRAGEALREAGGSPPAWTKTP